VESHLGSFGIEVKLSEIAGLSWNLRSTGSQIGVHLDPLTALGRLSYNLGAADPCSAWLSGKGLLELAGGNRPLDLPNP
jgi:hypothetical protein